jgi:hypothetical protein
MSKPLRICGFDITDVPYFLANLIDLALTLVTIALLSIAFAAFDEKSDVSGIDYDGRIEYFISRALVVSSVASVSYYFYFIIADHGKKKWGQFLDSIVDAANKSSYVLMGSSIIMAKAASWMSDLYSKDSTKDVRDRLNEAFYVQIALMGLRVINLARHKIYIEPTEKEKEEEEQTSLL